MTISYDKYLVIKVSPPDEEPFNKVFLTQSGGFMSGDSWRLNSGIKEVIDEGSYRIFVGESGSRYKVHKYGYGVAGVSNYGVLEEFKKRWGDKFSVYDADPYP